MSTKNRKILLVILFAILLLDVKSIFDILTTHYITVEATTLSGSNPIGIVPERLTLDNRLKADSTYGTKINKFKSK